MKKNKKEEFILYNNINNENIEIKSKDTKMLYNEIDKRQKRNAKILSISVFLYFAALAWLFGTMDYFTEDEQEILWFSVFILIILIATGLLIFGVASKSKIGKIKYQYKNIKYFYIACIFGGVGFFTLFGGLGIKNPYVMTTLGMLLIGLAASFDLYHDKTKGTKGNINLLMECLIVALILLVSGFGGYYLNKNVYKINFNDEMDKYYKTSELTYDKTEKGYLFARSNKMNYDFLKTNENHFELSATTKPEDSYVVYETDDVSIWHLYGNDNYAVWSEVKLDDNDINEVKYLFYDTEEEQVYELTTLPCTSQTIQNFNLGLYKDKIYYEVLDYENGIIYVNEFNITDNKEETIYTITGKTKEELNNQSIDINGNNLLVTTFLKGQPTIMHINLDKIYEENYKPNFIYLNIDLKTIYSTSYENGKYAIYYNDYYNDKIGLFDKGGKLIKVVEKYSKDYFVHNSEILIKDNNLYWITFNNKKDVKDVNRTTLNIYDIEKSKTEKIEKIIDFNFHKNKLYGLGFYGQSTDNVRLYEIWK